MPVWPLNENFQLLCKQTAQTPSLLPQQKHPTRLQPSSQPQNILINNSGPMAQFCTEHCSQAKLAQWKTLLGFFLSFCLCLPNPPFINSFLSVLHLLFGLYRFLLKYSIYNFFVTSAPYVGCFGAVVLILPFFSLISSHFCLIPPHFVSFLCKTISLYLFHSASWFVSCLLPSGPYPFPVSYINFASF